MLISTIALPNFAGAEASDFADYAPIAMPENMMTGPNKGEVFGNVNAADGSISKSFNNGSGWNDTYGAFEGYFIEAIANTTANAAFYSKLAGIVTTNGAGGLVGKTLVPGKAYVLSFLARNAGTTNSANVNFGLGNTDTWASCVYPVEVGEAGYSVESKGDWTKVAGTLVAPSVTPYLSIGFPGGTPQGTKIEMNLCYQPDDAIYFAEEVPYELSVSADMTQVENGDVIEASAELFNQIGTKGTLSQEFDWYVVNEDRTQVVDGFVVNDQGASAEIAVGDAAAGDYVIVAVNEENNMAKGIPFAVAGGTSGEEPGGDPDDGEFDEELGDYSDTTIPYPVNMMNNPQRGEVFGNANALDTVEKKANNKAELWNTTYESYNGYFIEAKETAQSQGPAYANVAGVTMADNVNASGMHHKVLVPGKSYVLSFLARNVGTTDGFTVNFGLTNTTNWTAVYPIENNGQGFQVTEKEEWTKVAGTLVAPQAAPFLSIGFVNGTPKGSKMEFNLCYLPDEAIYFAEEIPYNMEVTHNGSEILDNGSTVEFETKVTNQIGTTGNLTQSAKFYVVNEERNAKVAGFNFTSADGKKLMQISDSVEPGTYYVIAENIDNPAYKKGIKIQTQRRYQSDYVPAESANAGVPYDITVAAANQKASYSFLDTETVSAGICDIDGNELQGFEFEWKAYKENRRDEEANIVLAPSADTKTAELSFTSAIENGKYYIIARKTSPAVLGDGVQRSIEIVVDNTNAYDQISAEINGATAGDIVAKLDTYAVHADMPSDIYALVDKQTLAGIMEKTEFSADNFRGAMLSAAIVSLYVNNPQGVTLNNSEDLSFEYADELGLTALQDSGVTLMSLYSDTLTQAQRSSVMAVVNSLGVVSPKTFVEKLCESIILEGVKKSETMLGSGYVVDYITEANLQAANINKGKLTSTNATSYAERIAGQALTKEGLEAILAIDLSAGGSSSGSSGGSGGSGGGGSSGGSSGGGSSSGGSSSGRPSTGAPTSPTYRPVSSEAAQKALFDDVSDSHWAFKQIDFLKKQNIISGKDDNNFCPNDYLKREELTKIIVSAFDITGSANAVAFEDVVSGAWYESYIKVASSNGIIKGTSDVTFGIGENVTRQDLCVMIVRAMGKEDLKGADLVFEDKDEVASYAEDAVSYLNMMCVISGYEDNTFRPASPCTRAEAAKIIGDILNYEIKEVG